MTPTILDTHAVLWMAEGQLSRAAAARVTNAAAEESLFLCTISAWEIATLVRRNRLRLLRNVEAYVRDLFARPGLTAAALTAEIAALAGALADIATGDPADRIIAATAITYGADLMTRDKTIAEYAKRTKRFQCIAC